MRGVFFMGRKSKISTGDKTQAVRDYINGIRGYTQILKELKVSETTFRQWVMKYKANGEEGLRFIRKNTFYPELLKQQAVEEYLEGKISQEQICIKYKITGRSILQKWIKKYNGHEITKSHNLIGDKIMTKGRKTTYEERVEIVSFCIENNDNYKISAEKFKVSYQQVYSWIKRYKESGPQALTDNRGKRKKPDEMNETYKLAAKVRLLEAENKRLQMENGFLKKLKEVERRRIGKTNI
jgi:transposase